MIYQLTLNNFNFYYRLMTLSLSPLRRWNIMVRSIEHTKWISSKFSSFAQKALQNLALYVTHETLKMDQLLSIPLTHFCFSWLGISIYLQCHSLSSIAFSKCSISSQPLYPWEFSTQTQNLFPKSSFLLSPARNGIDSTGFS